VVFNIPNKKDIQTLKSILDSHPKKASTPSIMHGTTPRISIYLKCKDIDDLTDTLKKLTDSVPNTTTYPLSDSGYLSTPAKEQLRKSGLFAIYIFLATFFGGSTISSFLEHLDLHSSTWFSEFLYIITKAALIAIPPTVVAFCFKKIEKLES
jgi:hypothetical protein